MPGRRRSNGIRRAPDPSRREGAPPPQHPAAASGHPAAAAPLRLLSNQHIYAQVIDDGAGRTLAAASDLEETIRGEGGTKSERARAVGRVLAVRAREKGLTSVVFDRGGFSYAGRVRALAEAAREEGLVF